MNADAHLIKADIYMIYRFLSAFIRVYPRSSAVNFPASNHLLLIFKQALRQQLCALTSCGLPHYALSPASGSEIFTGSATVNDVPSPGRL